MNNIEAIVSDADGTLVNTVSLIHHGQYEAAITFLQQHGIPASEIPEYKRYETLLNRVVGGSAHQTLERTVRALYEDKTHHLEGIDYDQLHNLLNPIQDRLAPELVKPFPYLADTLAQIGKAGIKLGIFSSGTPHHIVRNFGIALRDQVGDYATLYMNRDLNDQTKLDMFIKRMTEVFDIPMLTIVTCDDVLERAKPDPTSALLAMERLEVTPEHTVVLGDHAYDIATARNAGIETRIGITHGFGDETSLRESGAGEVINSLSELFPVLARLELPY